jgi:hypothetical protein
MTNPFIYLRGLKKADHTVFCVQDGQKTYYDAQFQRSVPYSSGQQVKRSILDALTSELNVQMAPITFNYNITANKELENKEPWSPCDPSYVDQLIGGWMKAGDGITVKRRSPLSISAMHPLHPLLVGTVKENLTFDRSDKPNNHPVRVMMGDKQLSEIEIQDFLDTNKRTLPRRNWIPENKRASGLFVYDIAIDLRTLFCVSTNQHEPELRKEIIEKLEKANWKKSKNIFGDCLVCPKEDKKDSEGNVIAYGRDSIIKSVARALVNWRITSNQARTFSLMETLAISISGNANKIASSIRAKLIEEEENKVKPIIDQNLKNVETFISLSCAGYISVKDESEDALENAEEKLIELMMAFDYENQV